MWVYEVKMTRQYNTGTRKIKSPKQDEIVEEVEAPSLESVVSQMKAKYGPEYDNHTNLLTFKSIERV